MALDQSVLSELAEVLKSTDGVDLVREAVRLVLQELVEAEATAVIGAEPYDVVMLERTAAALLMSVHCGLKLGDIRVV